MNTKNIFQFLIFLSLISLNTSCKKELNGNFSLVFNHKVGSENLIFKSPIKYSNSSGNVFNVSVLKYIISNVKLTKTNGEIVDLNVYKVVDLETMNNTTIEFKDVKYGEYQSISFILGVDSIANNDYITNGNKPATFTDDEGLGWPGMGYRFIMFEGEYKKTINDTAKSSFGYHIGVNENINVFKFSGNKFTINNNSTTANIDVDILKFFDGKNVWDISKEETNHSESFKLISTHKLGENMGTMFSLNNVLSK